MSCQLAAAQQCSCALCLLLCKLLVEGLQPGRKEAGAIASDGFMPLHSKLAPSVSLLHLFIMITAHRLLAAVSPSILPVVAAP